MRIRTCATRGDNGEKIGPLKEHRDELDSFKMRHCAEDVGVDLTCELQNEELKVLLKNENFSVKDTNKLVNSKSLLCANDHANMNKEHENGNENANDADNA